MNIASKRMDISEAQGLLDLLPSLYFAVLKNTSIEQDANHLVRCTFELPILGKRIKTASSAIDAMKDALSEISELLTSKSEDDLNEILSTLLASNAPVPELALTGEKADRFRAKNRQITIGVTVPVSLKNSLQEIAKVENISFSEVARNYTNIGFEEFDRRIFSEGSKKVISEFLQDTKRWDKSATEQIMLRTDPYLGVRLRTSAKEFRKSASEFGTMCMAHGLVRQLQLELVEQKVSAVRGSALRNLAPKMGLASNVALLSGVLAGSIEVPKKLLKHLSEYFEATELSLITFFKLSCDSRSIPAFKAETDKPKVCSSATSWEEAVKSSGLSESKIQELLELDN